MEKPSEIVGCPASKKFAKIEPEKNHLYREFFEQFYVWAGFRRANSPSSSGHCNVHMGDSCVSGLRQVPAVFLHEHSAPRSKLFSHGAAQETDTHRMLAMLLIVKK